MKKILLFYSNSALIRLANASVVIGFLMKHHMLISGYTALPASILISPEIIKHTTELVREIFLPLNP
jgi:hypothetical protein